MLANEHTVGNNAQLHQEQYVMVRNTGPEGSWICVACNNLNFPTRVTCNGRNCGRPRAEVDGGPPDSMTFEATAADQVEHRAVPAPGDAQPEGSWVCAACQNVNYPMRTTCNRRTCGRPRAEVDAGPALPHVGVVMAGLANTVAGLSGVAGATGVAGGLGAGGAPLGSWVCPSCQNVNFPNRTNCNKHNCGLPRPQDL